MAKDTNLGVIVKIYGSGIRETDKGEKTTVGEIGDTLMMGENRKSYVVPRGEEKKADKQPQKAPPPQSVLDVGKVVDNKDGVK